MLTAKENMREVIRGGNPDRVVNQYEAVQLLMHPHLMFSGSLCQKGGPDAIAEFHSQYGILRIWRAWWRGTS